MSASDESKTNGAGPDPAEDPQIAELTQAMNALKAERDKCDARRRELMAAEDPAAGVFYAAEIFRLGQEKLRLQVEMECRRNKINRIRLGAAEQSLMNGGGKSA